MKELRNSRKSGFLWIIAAGMCWLGGYSASAQVLVYRLEFEKAGSSINLDLYDGGFFAVEGLGGSGSFVFTYREDGKDFYLRADDAGELFFAVKPGVSRAVIRATADSVTALAHYLVHGRVKDSVSVNVRGQKITFKVAPSLEGYVLASDSEANAEFPREDGTLGFAGTASMKALLQRGMTDDVNKQNLDPNGVIDLLVEGLEGEGFSDGSVDDGGDDGGGVGDDGGDGGDGGDGDDDGAGDGEDGGDSEDPAVVVP